MSPDTHAATQFDFGADWRERPGAVIGVLTNGRVESWRGNGRMSRDPSAASLTPRTLFYVASVSKQFTAACVALLEQRGTLSVAQSIRHYVPELPAAFDPVTLLHLLHHTSGTPSADPFAAARGFGSDWWNGRGLWDLIAVLRDADALVAPPGEAYRYSNEGYWLLAAAVERANGTTLARFAEAKLFLPLGMTHSVFRDDPGVTHPNLALGHTKGEDGLVPVHTRFHGVGDGGLLTTLDDLALWDVFWSGRSPLGADLPRRLTTQGHLNDGALQQYAWGVSVRPHRGVPVIGHGGEYIGYRAKFVRFPQQDFSIACLANADDVDVDGLSAKLADAVLNGDCDLSKPSWIETLNGDGRA